MTRLLAVLLAPLTACAMLVLAVLATVPVSYLATKALLEVWLTAKKSG